MLTWTFLLRSEFSDRRDLLEVIFNICQCSSRRIALITAWIDCEKLRFSRVEIQKTCAIITQLCSYGPGWLRRRIVTEDRMVTLSNTAGLYTSASNVQIIYQRSQTSRQFLTCCRKQQEHLTSLLLDLSRDDRTCSDTLARAIISRTFSDFEKSYIAISGPQMHGNISRWMLLGPRLSSLRFCIKIRSVLKIWPRL